MELTPQTLNRSDYNLALDAVIEGIIRLQKEGKLSYAVKLELMEMINELRGN